MIRTRRFLLIVAALAVIVAPGAVGLRDRGGQTASQGASAATVANDLGRGVNFAALEAPTEGAWGPKLTSIWFARAAQAGFSTVRLPVRWSNHAAATAPYAIDETFLRRVDFAIAQARRRGLRIVVNMHHYRQLEGDPLDDGDRKVDDAIVEDRFVALWKQIAERYVSQPETVLFELYNEPHNRLTADRWNALFPRALAAVRESNPDRLVVVGPVGYNDAGELKNLRLPAGDSRLITTIHSYAPFPFTHQGASWVGGEAASWLGTTCCSKAQIREMSRPMDIAKRWSTESGRPVWVGEFGSYEKGDLASRARHTRTARRIIEKRGFSWAYWEFAGGFGIYDGKAKVWRPKLRDALMG